MNNEHDMFYGATPITFEKAKSLRKKLTPSEKQLWELLKDGNFPGYKFRRQHPMGIYIADFYCHKLKLVIELDGNHHLYNKKQIEHDKLRSEDFTSWNINTIRYLNSIALNSPDIIVNHIKQLIKEFETKNP